MNTQSQTSTTPAIVTPIIDLLCVGALSIVAIAVILVVGPERTGHVSFGTLLIAATLVNGAHFMASYRLLYISREQILRYKSASLYIPIALVLYGGWSLFQLAIDPHATFWIQGLLVAASFYLAVHYTGQTWGMMASFSVVEKTYFDAKEKLLFKICLKALLLWQIVWALYLLDGLPHILSTLRAPLNFVTDTMAIGAFLLGSYTFLRMAKRIGRKPPIRIMIPFFTLFFWYALLAQHPVALIGVQFSHAIQYLLFPVRVEINRHRRTGSHSPQGATKHLLSYTVAMLITAALFFVFIPEMLEDGFSAYSKVLIALINIHHFYIDGCIWKISSPYVKEDLFAHLSP